MFFFSDPIMARAVLYMCIADEAALKDQYSFKGAAGVKPCFCCRNVISHDRGRERARPIGDYVCTICCGDTTKFDLATDEDIWRMYDNLKAMVGVVNKGDFELLERASGMNYNPHGILHDEELRKYVLPASSTRLDPMHCLVANGVCTTEVHVFLVAMKKSWAWVSPSCPNLRLISGSGGARARTSPSFSHQRKKPRAKRCSKLMRASCSW